MFRESLPTVSSLRAQPHPITSVSRAKGRVQSRHIMHDRQPKLPYAGSKVSPVSAPSPLSCYAFKRPLFLPGFNFFLCKMRVNLSLST